ncbi:uncharacterized protein PAC_16887 [Phialocephala subalpina]|uniref:C2H2-type domain-containing protein n=1 Tax=Phialocephala subalpina TaxID=576137 RepID=A0A1L7XPU6_9HELO|nr:uncharacterized protein PAC_16887 [Phialocephala subalpina]
MRPAISMSQDQHIIEGLKLALDAFKNVLDDPKLAALRPHAESITSLHLDTFFQQRDIANPSLNLTAKLSPIKTVLDLTYKAACETYGFEEATVQQLYGCLQCALAAGHNIYHQDMSNIVELLDQTGWGLRSIVIGQSQMQMSRQLSACVCLISEQLTRLCTVYISQGISAAEKLAHSRTWNLIRDAHNEYKTKQSAELSKPHQSQERFHKIETEQRYTEIFAPAQRFDNCAGVFECDDCNRYFGSQNALNQHLDSPAHIFECDDCDRFFKSEQALNQHLNSSAHAFECDDCDRCFKSRNALNQHLDSSAHTFECDDCDRCFKSQQALNQHLNSPAHTFECDDCDRCFKSQHALDQHFNSPIHANYW